MGGFRHRGVSVVVDTTDVAEFDIADHKISEDFLETVAKNFASVPFSNTDVAEGNLRAHTMGEYDFFFTVGRHKAEMVVTIGGVQIHECETKLQKALKVAEKIGMLRGATGI